MMQGLGQYVHVSLLAGKESPGIMLCAGLAAFFYFVCVLPHVGGHLLLNGTIDDSDSY